MNVQQINFIKSDGQIILDNERLLAVKQRFAEHEKIEHLVDANLLKDGEHLKRFLCANNEHMIVTYGNRIDCSNQTCEDETIQRFHIEAEK